MRKVVGGGSVHSMLTKKGIVLADFLAPWCSPCKVLGPIVDGINESNPDVTVVKVDVDEYSGLAQDYSIRNVPTLLFIKDGKVETRLVGLRSNNDIQEVLDSMKDNFL